VKYLRRFILLLALIGILISGLLSADDLIHVVGRGETIYSISRFYRVAADELMRVNNITDPSTLQVGRRLIIPSNAFSEVTVVPGAQTNVPVLVDYSVVRGDTLFSIARLHGITLQRLLEINRFSSNHVLRAGDVIRVPGSNPAVAVQNTPPVTTGGIYSLRWPIVPRQITYMTGQMGVVVDGELNESIRSLTAGNVVSAGPWRKFGRVVIVEAAGGYFYMYGGIDTMLVSVGDRIMPGAEVGRLGLNTVSQIPQLFFMVFRSDTPIDPALAPRAGDNNRT